MLVNRIAGNHSGDKAAVHPELRIFIKYLYYFVDITELSTKT